MKPTVVIDVYLHADALKLLGEKSRIVNCEADPDKAEIAQREDAFAAIITPTWQFTADVMDRIPSLMVVGRPGIGVDNIDIGAATDRGILVVNTPDAPTTSTAEHAVALILALAKRHKPATRLLSTGKPFTEEPMLIELKGRVLGLVGLGRVGKMVAHICGVGLGMNVVAYDPYVSRGDASELRVSLCPSLQDLLQSADFVSLHCIPSEETRHIINSETLALMKPTACLINTGRGVLVDEQSLVEALQSGAIAAAGLDVFDREPPSPTNPLCSMENVVATPHTAGFTEGCQRRMGLGVAQEILDVLDGNRPANILNPDLWDSPIRRGCRR